MKYTWMFIIPPIAIGIVIFISWYRYRLHSHDRDLKRVAVIAHTKTIKLLPEYRKAARRYKLLLALTALSFAASVFTFTAVAARPVSREERNTANENRDVVLCLDVSGSMSAYQEKLLEHFANIASGLHGQRIGLTIFDGSPATLIPLTDDYDAVVDLAKDLSKNFSSYSMATYSVSGGSSAIGDGVMGCINNLDNLDNTERSKSVIIATDNYAGSETVDINQVARYAKRYGITFYGISIGSIYSEQERLFQNAVSITGGSFYNINSYSGTHEVTDNIIQKVLDQEAAKIAGTPEVVYSDAPDILLLISAASFALFIGLVWRLRI